MEIRLAENIRKFRKQRSLTQEQLAEVLGVTVGAVYKWEAKLSQPELSMIMAMADFFDTSVDVLLGYEMKNNHLKATVDRLKKYRHDKDREGLREAEKALKKYPNAFDVVYNSATLYCVFGLESREKALLRRALELMDYAILLLPLSTGPEISELTIYGDMAEAYLAMDEEEQAVELLRKHNAGGIYNDLIGLMLASGCNRPNEALPFLAEALLRNTTALIRTVTGYVNVFFRRKDYASAQAILLWGTDVLSGLRDGEKPSFLDKMNSVFFVCLAYTQIKSGDDDAARRSLRHAGELAERFDAAPDYDVGAVRFAAYAKQASAYDDLGATGRMSIQNALSSIGDDALTAMWKELTEHEE